MTNPTISQHCREAQDILNKANRLLATTRGFAHDIGLAPFRIAHLTAAMDDNTHAWQELDQLATALETTTTDRKL